MSSAFAWNPFKHAEMLVEVKKTPVKKTTEKEATEVNALVVDEKGEENQVEEEESSEAPVEFQLPPKLVEAYEDLEKALDLLAADSFEKSAQWAAKAAKRFDAVSSS